jgi:hypothetical protein
MTQNDADLPEKIIDIYYIEFENENLIVATKQTINRYINGLKRKKFSCINPKNLNNYPYILLEKFKYKTKQQLNEKINEYKLLQNLRTKKIEEEIIEELYSKATDIEDNMLLLLKDLFPENNIIKTKNRYSKYDFFDTTTHNIFELKCNTYSITKYPNAVVNVEKLSYQGLILIFGYTEIKYNKESKSFMETKNFYFIQYDKEKFKQYNKRFIISKTTGRSSLVYDIPVTDLKPIKELILIPVDAKRSALCKFGFAL